MPITIQNQPSAGIIGGAANLVGLGQYEERRRAERAKYYQLAQQERMQVRGLQAQDYFQNKQFAVQAQRDQMNAFVQQRRDERVGLMQEERDERLNQLQLDRFGKQAEINLNAEGKAKQQEFTRRRQRIGEALTSGAITQAQFDDVSFRLDREMTGFEESEFGDDTLSMEEDFPNNIIRRDGMIFIRDPETRQWSATQDSRYGRTTPATFDDTSRMHDADGNPIDLYLDPSGTLVAFPPTAEQALENERETQRLDDVAQLNRQIAQERTKLRAMTRMVARPDGQNFPERVHTDAEVDRIILASYGDGLRALGVEPPPPPPPPPLPSRGDVLADYGFPPNASVHILNSVREFERLDAMYPNPSTAPDSVRRKMNELTALLQNARG